METIIIIGKQGTGKTTLAKTMRRGWNKDRVIENSVQSIESSIIERIGKMDPREPKTHYLFIDECDVFATTLETKHRTVLKNYWGLARHLKLKTAIFIARRYVQIPIFFRASATSIYIPSSILMPELKAINNDHGLEIGLNDRPTELFSFVDVLQ